MKKRFLKAALAVLLILSLVLCFAACGTAKVPDAEDADGSIDETDIDWDYNSDDKTLTLEGTGSIPDFESSEDVPWYGVRHSVEEIEISEGITYIGDYAFYYCPELTSVDIPDTVTYIGDQAFAFCSSLEGVEIPDGVTEIGEGCFEACRSLEGIYLPASVTSIGARAFAHCAALEEAVIMSQISSIDTWTFMGCKALDELCFHESVKEISVADDAFEDAASDFSKATFTVSLTGEVTLTVNYVYEDGSEAATAHVETLKRGASYSVVSPTVDGYTASELTVSGVISGDETVTVTYVAEEAEGEETEAETEAAAETEEESDKVGVGTVVAIIIFVVVIVAIIVLVIFMMRSDKKQQNGAHNKNGGNKKNKKK